MPTATHLATRLAYDSEGAGPPVVLLHGLTFNRRTWRPIVDKLGSSIRSIAIDLPAHGESGGAPAPLEQVAVHVHELLASLDVERPVVGATRCPEGLHSCTHRHIRRAAWLSSTKPRMSDRSPRCSIGSSPCCAVRRSRVRSNRSRTASASSAFRNRCSRSCAKTTPSGKRSSWGTGMCSCGQTRPSSRRGSTRRSGARSPVPRRARAAVGRRRS